MRFIATACSFTGHRPHKLPWKDHETDPRCTALKSTLAEQIAALTAAGVTDYYSGGADGTDCYAAEVVLSLRKKNPALKLHCVLPCKEQAEKWDATAQKRYYSILQRADSVTYVSQKYYDGCMIDRSPRLVESAGLLLAVYNGVRRSGTGATVNYARKMGREIIIIDPLTRAVTHEGGGV